MGYTLHLLNDLKFSDSACEGGKACLAFVAHYGLQGCCLLDQRRIQEWGKGDMDNPRIPPLSRKREGNWQGEF